MSAELPFDEGWTGTPVLHLLRTNVPPTDSERQTVLSLLQEYEREIEELTIESQTQWQLFRSRIRELYQSDMPEDVLVKRYEEDSASQKVVYDAIHTQITSLSNAQEKHRTVLSLIRVLPPELVREIFLYAQYKRPFHEEQSTMINVVDTFNIKYKYGFTQVCSRWRDIALDTPLLWTVIPTIYEQYRGTRISGYARLICAFLERSKTLPLDIAICIRHQYDRGPLEDSDEDRGAAFPLILVPLINESTRWKTAVIHLHEDHIRYLPPLKLPILERLNIRLFDDNPHTFMLAGQMKFPSDLFWPTPMLKEVVTDGPYDWHGEGGVEPRRLFEGLEKFVGLPKTSIDLEFARATLVDCIFRGPLSRSLVVPNAAREFPVMKTLQVIHNNYQTAHFGWSSEDDIFTAMKAPHLESLLVEGHPDIDEADTIVSHIVQTTLPAPSLLTSLTLRIAGLTKDIIARILPVTPALEELDIYEGAISAFDWADLVAGSNEEHNSVPLLRKLRSLVINRASNAVLGILYSANELRRSRISPDSRHAYLSIHVNFIDHQSLLRSLSLSPGWDDKSFEQWTHPARGSEHTKLNGWAIFLAKEFIGFQMWFGRKKLRGRKIKHKSVRFRWKHEEKIQLNTVFTAIEAHQVEDARLLEVSGIFFAMEQLARYPQEQYISGCEYLKFQPRARALSETWKSLLEARKSEMPQHWELSEDGLSAVI